MDWAIFVGIYMLPNADLYSLEVNICAYTWHKYAWNSNLERSSKGCRLYVKAIKVVA